MGPTYPGGRWPAATRLDRYLNHLGIPIVGVSLDSSGRFVVTYQSSATAGQIAQGNQVAATWPPDDHRARPLWAIHQDVNALSAKQQGNINTDLLGGSPPKALATESLNTPSIFVATGVGGAENYVIALYTQVNIFYLTQPSFDPTINIPGTEPVQ